MSEPRQQRRRHARAGSQNELVIAREIGPWTAQLFFDTSREVPAAVALTISLNERNKNAGNTEVLSGEVLRSIPFRQMVEEASRRLPEEVLRHRQPLRDRLQARRFSSERDYAELARAYAELVEQGHRSPVTTLARMYGVSTNTIAARVTRARNEYRLLTKGTRGRPGGALTARARRTLGET